MSARLVGAVALAELLVAAPIAFWLMWRFAFRGMAAYYTGNTLIALTFALPVLIGIWVHARSGKKNAQD